MTLLLYIYKPDKGSGVVIFNRRDYINKKTDILIDNSKLTRTGSDDEFEKTAIQEQRIQRQWLSFYHLIPKNIYERYPSLDPKYHGYIVSIKSINPYTYSTDGWFNLASFS